MIRRAYRALLRLLPFEFRADVGRDMEQTFADEHEDVMAQRSTAGTVAFWLRTMRDFIRTAPRQHLDILRQDVRVGVRHFSRNPGFAVTAILTLALGIGGSTSIFSVVYAVVLRPLDFPESERVVRVGWLKQGGDPTQGMSALSYEEVETLQRNPAFEAIGVTRYDSLSTTTGSLSVAVPGSKAMGGTGQSFVSSGMASAAAFRIFGASTVLGRLPDSSDEQPGATPVAVLSYATWTSRYGQDPKVIGQTLVRSSGGDLRKIVTIVGVLVPGAMQTGKSPIETPAWGSLDPDVVRLRDEAGHPFHDLSTVARLAPHASLAAARTSLSAITPAFVPMLSKYLAEQKPSLDVTSLRAEVVGSAGAPMIAFLAAVSCLLFIAAVNVTSLILARVMSRRSEFATRFALGARSLRVARQLLTEGALLAICGGALGLGLAWLLRRAFVSVSPAMPRLAQANIGIPEIAFTLGSMAAATCLAGIVPALQASRRSVLDGLRRAGGPSYASTAFSRPLATLAAVEVALVLVLVAGTGLLVNSFGRLVLFDLGFDARGVTLTTIQEKVQSAAPPALPPSPAHTSVAMLTDRQRELHVTNEQLLQRVSAIPGVRNAALTADIPFGSPYRYSGDVGIRDAPPGASAVLRLAGPTALEALGMEMAAGRWFTADDRDGTALVAVINQTMAQRFWISRSPLDDRMIYGRRDLRIIGILRDVYDRGARREVTPTFYMTTSQLPPEPVILVVRAQPGAARIDEAVAAQLATMGDRVTVGNSMRPREVWWMQLEDARFLTIVLAVFSALALIIALVGVHGVLRFLVHQRTREMGIRKALGATRGDIVKLVMRQAFRFVVPGCVAGLVGALVLAPALRSLLFGITPADPATFVAASLVLILAVGAGAYFPARRAGAVDPSVSLRD